MPCDKSYLRYKLMVAEELLEDYKQDASNLEKQYISAKKLVKIKQDEIAEINKELESNA